MIKDQLSELTIRTNDLKKASLIFRAVNHNLRQKILHLLHKEESATVTEIYKKLHLEQSVASQHLAILRQAGYVLTKRDRKFIYYKINYKKLMEVQLITIQLIDGLSSKCTYPANELDETENLLLPSK